MADPASCDPIIRALIEETPVLFLRNDGYRQQVAGTVTWNPGSVGAALLFVLNGFLHGKTMRDLPKTLKNKFYLTF